MKNALLLAVMCTALPAAADTRSNSDDAQRRAAAEQARRDRNATDDAGRVQQQLGLDPSRIRTVGLWKGRSAKCKLPKRAEPYDCYSVLDGPAIILSRLPMEVELFAAQGDAAAARGERNWWVYQREMPVPIAIAAGETLYLVNSNSLMYSGDLVVTLYR